MRTALGRCLCQLDLVLDYQSTPLHLPEALSLCPLFSLNMRLHGTVVSYIPTFNLLRNLGLSIVYFKPEVTHIFNSVNLRNVDLYRCIGVHNLTINSQYLQSFRFWECVGLDLQIHARNITRLRFCFLTRARNVIVTCDRVQDFMWRGAGMTADFRQVGRFGRVSFLPRLWALGSWEETSHTIGDFVRQITGISDLKISVVCLQALAELKICLPELRHVVVYSDNMEGVCYSVIRFLLIHPNLNSITLKVENRVHEFDPDVSYSPLIRNDENFGVPEEQLNLRSLHMQVNTGGPRQARLTAFVVQHCKNYRITYPY
ncbi:hypothetical protein AQUCO_02000074v1 [Aquilegia coerulea]|uniref:FBD domain-containing protein n=1 Tax=Aquilegia coerulea TaxID=218851 RepID=A0A2G5DFU3_AQUCA|nr:hypothetical protein AQUCO_02000074v1 [Aquilegia coerulea]